MSVLRCFSFLTDDRECFNKSSVDDRSDSVEQAVLVYRDGSFGIDVGLPMISLVMLESLP